MIFTAFIVYGFFSDMFAWRIFSIIASSSIVAIAFIFCIIGIYCNKESPKSAITPV